MKDCEPLRGKKQELLDKLLVQVNEMTSSQKGTGFDKGYNLGFETAVNCAFDRFASAVKFYKRYRNRPYLLSKERKEIYEKMEKDLRITDTTSIRLINNWIFDYCFEDVI